MQPPVNPSLVSLRPATPADADFAVPLIQATIGSIGHALTGTDNDADAAAVMTQLFRERGHRLSYQQTHIAEVGGERVGLAVLYPGEAAHALDEPLRRRLSSLGQPANLSSEGEPGELYLDTLALIPAARGQGWGGQLLDACAELARQQHLTLALLVEDGNPAARLYARSGFVAVGRMELAGHGYTRMHRS